MVRFVVIFAALAVLGHAAEVVELSAPQSDTQVDIGEKALEQAGGFFSALQTSGSFVMMQAGGFEEEDAKLGDPMLPETTAPVVDCPAAARATSAVCDAFGASADACIQSQQAHHASCDALGEANSYTPPGMTGGAAAPPAGGAAAPPLPPAGGASGAAAPPLPPAGGASGAAAPPPPPGSSTDKKMTCSEAKAECMKIARGTDGWRKIQVAATVKQLDKIILVRLMRGSGSDFESDGSKMELMCNSFKCAELVPITKKRADKMAVDPNHVDSTNAVDLFMNKVMKIYYCSKNACQTKLCKRTLKSQDCAAGKDCKHCPANGTTQPNGNPLSALAKCPCKTFVVSKTCRVQGMNDERFKKWPVAHQKATYAKFPGGLMKNQGTANECAML